MERGEIFFKQVGGAELNVASGAALLGLRTGIISKLPANSLGTYVKNRVRFVGVSDDYLVYDSDSDARLGIYYYENGAYPRKPSVVYDRAYTSINKLRVKDYDEEMYASTRMFHTSGITLALGTEIRAAAIQMMKKFKEKSTLISFDVDRIGSGDAYVSGVLYGLLANQMDCGKALEYGNAAGAVKKYDSW